MGKGSSGGTNTVVQNSQPPQAVLDQYSNVIGQANQVAQTPYSTGGFNANNLVAGFSPDQLSAFSSINNAQGLQNPYEATAQNYLSNSQTPIWNGVQQYSPSSIANYMNPYLNSAVSSTEAQMNNVDAQQQQQVVGNAISAGAWGGDRSAIAQSELANQQDLANNQTIAGMENTGFAQQQQEFNTEQQNQIGANEANAWLGTQGSALETNLGTTALTNQLNAAAAQANAGSQQQQLEQEQLNVPYEQFQAQEAYPFQTTSWLSDISTGVGGSEGGTGTTTSPAANQTSQTIGSLAGLGTLGYLGYQAGTGLGLWGAAAAAAANRGGAISGLRKPRASGGYIPAYDNGGGIGGSIPDSSPDPSSFENGYVPKLNNVNISTANMPRAQMRPPGAPHQYEPPQSNAGQQMSNLGTIAGLARNNNGGLNGIVGNRASGASMDQGMVDSSAGTSGDLQGFMNGTSDDLARGGVPHYDMGGGVGGLNPAMTASNPMVNNQYSQLMNLPVEKLQQLAAQYGGAPQGAMIKAALQKKMMSGGTSPQPQQSTQQPQAGLARGGVPHRAFGGEVLPDIVSGVGDVVGAFFGDPMAGSQFTGLLNQLDGGKTDPGLQLSSLKRGGTAPQHFDDGGNVDDTAPDAGNPSPDTAPPASGIPTRDQFMKDYESKVINQQPYNKPDPTMAFLSTLGAIGAGKSSKLGVNMGQGAVEGLSEWAGQNKQAAQEALQKGSLEEHGENLYDQMVQHKETLNQQNERLLEESRHNQAAEANQQRQIEQGKFVTTPLGQVLNTKTGDLSGTNPFASNPAVDASGKPLTGDAYKTTLDPQRAANAQKVVDGDFQITPYMVTRNPQYMQMWNDAQRIDPSVSQERYNYKQSFLKSGGQGAKDLDTFNTVGGHLQLLDQAAHALDNNDAQTINAIRNTWREQMGSELPTNLSAARTMVAGELVKAVTGAGGVTDREKYEKAFSQNASDQQLTGAVNETKDLINQRVNAQAYRYKNTIGGDYWNNIEPSVRTYLRTPSSTNAAANAGILTAPPAQDQRVIGKTYKTPKGDMSWTKDGWEPIKANGAP